MKAYCAGSVSQLKQALVESGHWNTYAENFCDDACCMRYLRARSMDVGKAAAMLRATLEWRQETGVDNLQRSEFVDTPFMREGWVYVDGNDSEGRSVVLFRKRKDKFPMHLEQTYLRYMTFVIESAIQNMKNGQEQWIWVLDLAVYSSSNAPHMSVTLGVLQMLANHYPERLHKAYICNAPSIFSLAYKMISPFVDPVSKAKVEFVTTSEYGSGKAGKDTSSSWGSWFSSSKASSKPAQSTDSDGIDADVDVVVEDQAVKGPGTFGPFLHFYKTPFDYNRHQQLLSSVGLA
jgi:hypothetical protein